MTTATVASTARKISPLAIPFLGVLGAVQGAAPNISSTALVGASRGLAMVGSTQALAASAQTLAIAASVITTGLLADRIGRRKVLVAALVFSIVGNLVIAGAPVAGVYIAGQALAGIGLGAVYAAAFAYIQVVAQPGKIAGAIGLFSAVTMASTVALTFAGGALASGHWRLAFLVIPAAGVLGILGTLTLLPKIDPLPPQKHDVLGQVFLAVGLVSFLFGISNLASSLTSPVTWIPIALGVALLIGFYLSQRLVAHPFFPVELFGQPLFLAAICAGFIYNFGNAVAFLQMTNLWQYVVGLKTSEVSVWQLPLLISGIIGAIVFGRFMSRGLSEKATLLIGGLVTAVGFFSLFLAREATSFFAFVPGGVLVGAGVVIASLPYGSLILSEAPKAFFGPVTSSRTTVGQLFYSIGLATSTVVIDRMTHGGTLARLTEAGVPADQLGTGLSAVTSFASQGTQPTSTLGQQALKAAAESYTVGFGVVMIASALLVTVLAVAGFWLIRRAAAQQSPPAN